jgi:hypothetical protein
LTLVEVDDLNILEEYFESAYRMLGYTLRAMNYILAYATGGIGMALAFHVFALITVRTIRYSWTSI